MSLRDLLLRIHRWIGLAIGVVFCIASLTGGIVLFQPELEALINRGAFEQLTPGDVGIAAASEAALAAAAGHRIADARWPSIQNPAYQFQLAGPEPRVVWVDPGSGRVISKDWQPPIINGIRRIHTSLLLGRPGVHLVTFVSFLALFGMLSGLYLWWPGIRRFFRAFRVRLRRDAYVLSYDTHQVMGALFLPLLFFITFTGVILEYPGISRPLSNALFGDAAPSGPTWPPVDLAQPVPPEDRLGPAALFEAARPHVVNAEPLQVAIPADENEHATVYFERPGQGPKREIVSVLMDPANASVLAVQDPRTLAPGERLHRYEWMILHTGGRGGPVMRVLYALACLVGGLLVPTGYIVWWLKRRRIEAVSERRVRVPAG